MKGIRKLLMVCLMVFLVCSFISAAAQKEQIKSKKITLLTFTEYHAAIQATIDAYMAKNPDVTIVLEEYPFSEYNEAVTIKLGSKGNIDLVMTDTTMPSGYAYRGWIQSVDTYFTEQERAEFASALVDAGTYDGLLYSPPVCNSSQALFYNKDLLDRAGVQYPSDDPLKRLTWEEIVAISQRVISATNDKSVYGIVFEQVDRPYQVLPIPNSLGANAFSPDGMKVDGYLNSPKFVEAMQWYSDIHNVYNVAPRGVSASDSVGLFQAGKVAFIVANVFNYATFDKLDTLRFGYAPYPYFKQGAPATPTGSWHLSLAAGSNNVDASIDFMKYFTLGEGNKIFLDTRGAFASSKATLEAYQTDSAYANFPQSIMRLASYEAQNTAYPRPSTLAYGEFETIVESAFADIRNGLNVTDALNSAVQRLNTQLAMYK